MSKPEYVLNEGGQEKGISRLHIPRKAEIAFTDSKRKKKNLRELERKRKRRDPRKLKGKTNRTKRKIRRRKVEERRIDRALGLTTINGTTTKNTWVEQLEEDEYIQVSSGYNRNLEPHLVDWLEEIEDPDFAD